MKGRYGTAVSHSDGGDLPLPSQLCLAVTGSGFNTKLLMIIVGFILDVLIAAVLAATVFVSWRSATIAS
jgi:hypothetical protein